MVKNQPTLVLNPAFDPRFTAQPKQSAVKTGIYQSFSILGLSAVTMLDCRSPSLVAFVPK
jgi:hypothetical protein